VLKWYEVGEREEEGVGSGERMVVWEGIKYENVSGKDFPDLKKKQANGRIDFAFFESKINQKSATDFEIELIRNGQVFYFRAPSRLQLITWVGNIEHQLKNVKSASICSIPPIPEAYKFESISEKDFLKTCETGDLILMRVNGFMPRLQ